MSRPGVPAFDPAKQVPRFEVETTREVLGRLLDGGGRLAPFERHTCRETHRVLGDVIAGFDRRAARKQAGEGQT